MHVPSACNAILSSSQGCIDFLTGDTFEAEELRKQLVFKVVPMLCPDGVINGSYRCGLAGCDLNRQWDKPSPVLHPTIYHARAMVQQLSEAGRLSLFVDLHGHSMRDSAFAFGCDPLIVKNAAGAAASSASAEAAAPFAAGPASERTPSIERDASAALAKLSERELAQLRVRMLPHLLAQREPLFDYQVRLQA